MRVIKVFNNNVILARTDSNQELVLMGKGIGFHKKIKDTVEESKIYKRFVLDETTNNSQLEQILEDVPMEELNTYRDILEIARKKLTIISLPNLFITLSDHLHYTIERYREGVVIGNPLLFEIKKFYTDEFEVGLQMAEVIKKELGVALPEDEVGFIALHLVNAEEKTGDMNTRIKGTQLVKSILSIISKFLEIEYDESTLNYQRLVTHLQFFVQRFLSNQKSEDGDEFLYSFVKDKYSASFRCMQRINEFLRNTYQRPMDLNEKIYLTIHIERIRE